MNMPTKKQIGRIESEFILDTVRNSETTVELHVDVYRTTCRLAGYNEDRLRLAPLDDMLPGSIVGSRVALYFKQHGRVMTLKGMVAEEVERILTVEYDGHVYHGSSRDTERIIDPGGIGISLVLGIQKVKLRMLVSAGYEPVERPLPNLGFDFDAVRNLTSQFSRQSAEFAPNATIVMFRDALPTSVIERVMAHSGRTLIVPFYSEEVRTKYAPFNAHLLGREEAYRLASKLGVANPQAAFQARIGELHATGMARELLCPVLFRKYVIGYLHLKGVLPFTPEAIRYCVQFARVLAYSLRLKGYFRKLEEREPNSNATHLIDISGSGLLFSYPSRYRTFPLHSELEMQIHFERTSLHVRGRILRQYQLDEESSVYGVNFINIDTTDLELLYDRLYGTSYRGDIDRVGSVGR